jgi:hypothetical protein
MKTAYAFSLFGLMLICLQIAAQQPEGSPAATPKQAIPATYEGCVSKLPKLDKYVLATQDRCMLLSGNFKAGQVADRWVALHGLLLEASGMDPLTLQVDSPAVVKNSCTQTCKLVPPGTRGVHGKEKPGSDGGPPGVTKPPQQP